MNFRFRDLVTIGAGFILAPLFIAGLICLYKAMHQ
jgi:hypothetical protein